MQTVVLVIHLMLVAAMIAIVLMQRSEGGALGIGGGGNFMATRSSGNALTRATTILAAGFFITSIGLTIIARNSDGSGTIFNNLPANEISEDGAVERPGGGGLLDALGGGEASAVDPDIPADPGAADDTPVSDTPVDDGAAPGEIPN